MASSTTSVASSSQRGNWWKNDVFLSFEREDTGKGFVPHLHRGLTSAGITISNDYLLEIESPTKEQFLKAISESRISVVVLSPNYASSSWCLDELVEIMECRATKGQKVVPIFCGVDPSEVKGLTGKYGKALERHRERFLEDTVVMWEKALSEVGELPGWNLQDREEAMFIKHIVEDISDELLILSPRYNGSKLVGIASHMKELDQLLNLASDDVKLVGIHGIGKTTIAKVMYERISGQFEASCFLENVGEKTRQHGLLSLERELLSRVTEDRMVNDGLSVKLQGSYMTKEILKSKRLLLVLDDVDDEDQLGFLAGVSSWFCPGSRVIITTRDLNLLHKHEGIAICGANFLDKVSNAKYPLMVRKFISYGRELPLALSVLPTHLFGRNSFPLESLLLNFSPRNYLPSSQVKELWTEKQCMSSLTVLDLSHSNVIRIPDLSEAEALERMYLSNCKNLIDIFPIHYLKKLEHLDLEGCTSLQELPDTEGCVSLTTLILSGCSHLMELPKLASSIKYLYLEGLPIKELHPWCMPSLRVLDLSYSNVIRAPDLLETEALEIMYLSNCKNLIDVSTIQYLKKLKHLDLEDCTSLQELPDTEGCVNLITLILSGCSHLMELPKLSRSIKYLYLEGLPIKELHPSAKTLSNLVELDVRNCGRLRQIHVDLSKLMSLKKLRLAGSHKLLRHLGDGIPRRFNLEVEYGKPNDMDFIWDMVRASSLSSSTPDIVRRASSSSSAPDIVRVSLSSSSALDIVRASSSSAPDCVLAGWLFLCASLIIEAASSAFEQLQYPLMGMMLAILGLLLCAMDLKFKAWKEQATWQWRGSIPWIYSHHPHGKPFGTMIEYFGLVAAIWQVLHSTVGYIYALQKLQNPIRMTVFMFLFCLCLLVGKLMKHPRQAVQPSPLRSIVVEN